jgi:hypothetical protein
MGGTQSAQHGSVSLAVTDMVYELRKERRGNSNKHGDMVYENAILFMHDALLLHEFCYDHGLVGCHLCIPLLLL